MQIICSKCRITVLGESDVYTKMMCELCAEDYYRWMPLDEIKVKRCAEVDARSGTLILNGYFPFGENIFSMSQWAQINWTQLAAEINMGLQTFPQPISTKDDQIFYLDLENFEGFFQAMSAYKKALLEPAAILRIQINACKTAEEVKAIIDRR